MKILIKILAFIFVGVAVYGIQTPHIVLKILGGFYIGILSGFGIDTITEDILDY